MGFENQGIKCSIFWDAEAVIEKADAKIKEARSIKERKYYAQDILLEVQNLLMCSNYNAGDPECLSCHTISHRHIQEYEYLAKSQKKGVIAGSDQQKKM